MRLPRSPSLGVRLAAISAVTTLAIAGAAALVYDRALRASFREDSETYLRAKAHTLHLLLERSTADLEALRAEIDWNPPLTPYSQVYVRIRSEEGRVLAETSGFPAAVPPPGEARATERARESTTPDGRPLLTLLQRVTAGTRESPAVYWVEVALDLTRQRQTLERQRTRLEILLGAGALLTVVAGLLVSRVAVRPILRLTHETARLGRAPRSRLDPDAFPAELAPLARALGDLHARVHEQIRQLSDFAGNLAHEIRNPLNVLIGEAELALSKPRAAAEYRETLRSALDELRDLSALVDSLLFIARAENATEALDLREVDVPRLLTDVRELYEPLAADRGLELELTVPAGSTLRADRRLLARAIGNLLLNAIQYAGGMGARVRLGFAAAAEGGGELFVEDDGPGIPPELRERVFERLYRAPGAHHAQPGGTGLGLSIVRGIARLHGGDVSAGESAMGGARFTLRLPPPISAEAATPAAQSAMPT